jgi:regulator of sigma E protease
MQSGLIFVFVLSVLVVVHEFGHFIVAKMVGIRVEKFSIGFGPVIFGKKFGETEFVFSLLPLGGFVKMAGEDASEATGKPWEFNSKSLIEKFLVVFAGPFMNAFLAFVIFVAIFCVGQPTLTTKVGKLLEGSPAQAAGIKEGDTITAVNGTPVTHWEELLKGISDGKEKVIFTVETAGQARDLEIAPIVKQTKDIFGKVRRHAMIGVSPSSEVLYVKMGFMSAVRMALQRIWMMTSMIFISLGMMITGATAFKDMVTGPIGIFFMVQQAADVGLIYLFYFMGSLSVSLFVLNLLPIPVLDGGHVLIILIEKIKGSSLKESTKERMTQVGLFALLALMVVVILQDIHRFAIIENVIKFIKSKVG